MTVGTAFKLFGGARSVPQREVQQDLDLEEGQTHHERQRSGSHHGTYDAWMEVSRMLRERDEDNLNALSDELQGFLTFSSLFCAVITVFTSQSTASLQPDSGQMMIDILRTISLQLDGANVSAGDVDTTPFQRDILDVALNSLLSASLLCGLISSGMSMWALQWLREYTLDTPPLPRVLTRVRQHRYRGFKKWRMRSVIAAISICLQLSVLLFSIGVVMLAFKVDHTLYLVLLSLNVLWWFCTWLFAFCPTFSSNCPFKSPLSRTIYYTLFCVRRVFDRCMGLELKKFRDFEERELQVVEEESTSLELSALTYANREYWGDERLKKVNEHCWREVKDPERARKQIDKLVRKHLAERNVATDEGADYLLRIRDSLGKEAVREKEELEMRRLQRAPTESTVVGFPF